MAQRRVDADPPGALTTLFPDRPVHRGGRDYPAVIIDGFAGCRVQGLIGVDPPATLDAQLMAAGRSHLDATTAANPALFDGPVLALTEISGCEQVNEEVSDTFPFTRPPRIGAAVAGYFAMVATCDALRVEPAMRARVQELAGGDPLRRGTGRAAAIGISVATTVPAVGGREFLLVRRAPGTADAGLWDVVPSGTVEPAVGDPLITNAGTELKEELGVEIDARSLATRLTVIGVTVDLWRLRPEVCMRLDLSAEEAARLDDAALVSGGEHDRLRCIPLDRAGFAGLWKEFGPERFTPSAAGAIALLEESVEATGT